ncbi:MAG: hypothetical protein M1511_11040 [Deltaproteobacteria bacterium]|nr:hypothetical protein [Deltaproteobacteria bacterium]
MIRYGALLVFCFLMVIFASQSVLSQGASIESLVLKVGPDGWTMKDAPEMFTRETLFEHIDGQADLFIQYGFEKSVFAVYQKGNSSEDRIDLDIYDMGNPLKAFGVFSRFRQEGGSAGIGLDSSLGDRYAIFYKGKYFVVLQATDANASTLKLLANEVESRILDSSAPPKEIAYFPKSGLKPGSIEYFPDGLLGYQFLRRGFKASYEEKGESTTEVKTESNDQDFNLFLSIFENSHEATNALKLFKQHLLEKGRVTGVTSTQFGPDAVTGVDPYHGKTIVTRRGSCLLGAVGFEREKAGEGLLVELTNEIKRQSPKDEN